MSDLCDSLGFSISQEGTIANAVTVVTFNLKRARKYAAKFPNVIYGSTGEGVVMTGLTLLIAFHVDE